MTGITGACLAWVPLGFILGILGIVFGGIGRHFHRGGPDLPPTHPAQRIRRSTAFSLDGR